ncbi:MULTISPECIES: T9SS type A sorting domain-containing protein [unclassified Prevotella]|jgi:hypothetical protein|uniref:T9SS type A sorting domain-containing protein n=1 Tax=unclassified Prevotella TaxID=2638335 RepID=UPI000B86B6E4|nr:MULTISPECIES: T9SS type A sorting domain-containing protein [unclassified Prevotella]MCI1648650.1 T9SS type A sorting domain-containing protein [Bacteroides sp.]
MENNTLLLSMVLLVAMPGQAQQYVNPLERWAQYNVGELNTFTTGDEDITRGNYYQFGRNVALASEGEVLYWANQGGPYEDGSPQNYRVWHIHLLNNFNGAGNWCTGGLAAEKWEDVVARTVANGAPPAGTFEGYDYTVDGYVGNNGGSPAPKGWHLPSLAEAKSLIAFKITYGEVNESDFTETDVDILGNGQKQNYKSDYRSVDQLTVVALRFKGTPYETAYYYSFHNAEGLEINTFEIRAKPSNGATIDQIKAWTIGDWGDAVVRYFPTTGLRRTGDRLVVMDSQAFYWVGEASDANKAHTITFNDTRVLISNTHIKSNAYALRCVRDYEGPATNIVDQNAEELFVGQENGNLVVSKHSLVRNAVYVYSPAGTIIYQARANSNKLSVQLPKGIYLVKVGNISKKVIIK